MKKLLSLEYNSTRDKLIFSEYGRGAVKKGFVETILSYMKLSYRTWNKEHFVSDDIIISDLAVMSANKLSVDDDHTIAVITKNNLPNASINTFKTPKKPNKPNNQNKNPNNKPRPSNSPNNRPKRK